MSDKTNQTPAQNSIKLYSKLDGKVVDLPELARSLLFAELSLISYLPEAQTRELAEQLGFTRVIFHERDGSQVYSFINRDDYVIACRGTEPHEWNDVKADLDAQTALAETVGRVHRGFKQEVDDIWPMLEQELQDNQKDTWFTGHSLGGAMATICAGRCLLAHIPTCPKQIITFGSPRVGNKRYINYAKVDYLRWVNNNDIVTRVPPVWLGYRHTGKEMYLNFEGKLTNPTPTQKANDRWKGFKLGLQKGELDYFTDHSMLRYVEYIYQEALTAGQITATKDSA